MINYERIIYLIIIEFMIFIIILMSVHIFKESKIELTCSIKTYTEKIEVGCVQGGYPTHSNMICENGVEGDIKNKSNGIIWYCDGGLDGTKLCMYEVEEEICKAK